MRSKITQVDERAANAGGSIITRPTCRGRGRRDGQHAQVNRGGQRRQTPTEPHCNVGSTTSREERPTWAMLDSHETEKFKRQKNTHTKRKFKST